MFGRRKLSVLQPSRRRFSNLRVQVSRLSHRRVVKLPAANVVGVALCYLIGAWEWNVVLLVVVVLVMLSLWADSHDLLVKTVELQAETRLRRERAVTSGESVRWANHVINSWWTLCEPTVAAFVKDWVEPLVDAMKVPGLVDSMEVSAFDPGIYRPVFSNVQIMQAVAGSSGDTHEPISPKNLFISPRDGAALSALIAEVDCLYNCPKAVFEFSAFIGQKMFGRLQFSVDSFCVKGRLKCVLTFNPDLPFPNVATVHLAFVGKPDVQFTCKMSRSVELMEIPVVKDMTKEYIKYSFNKLFVYPEGIRLDFSRPPEPNSDSFPFQLAQGVLTVTIRGTKLNTLGVNYYWSLCLGSQKCLRVMDMSNRSWSSTFSFLVHNMEAQKLVVKLKTKKLLRAVTLEMSTVHLAALGLHITEDVSRPVIRTVGLNSKISGTTLDLIYTPLPPFSLTTSTPTLGDCLAGVLYVHVHGARDLIGAQLYGVCSPACVVRDGEKTLMVSRRVTNCVHPVWEQGVEMFIPNYRAMQLRVDVGNQTTRFGLQDIMGTSHIDLSSTDISQIVQHRLPLQIKLPSGITDAGSVFISVVFRPVASVLNTVLSLKADYVSRTHRHSLANCLDLTTRMLNPSVQGSKVSYSETKLMEYCSDGEMCSDDSM